MGDINEIYAKFLDRKCTQEEMIILMAHFQDKENAHEILELIQAELDRGAKSEDIDQGDVLSTNRNWIILDDRIQQNLFKKRNVRYVITVAASVLLVTIGALFYYYSNSGLSNTNSISAVESVLPGTNKATITFSDGQVLNLNEEQSGVVVGEELSYEDGSSIATEQAPYATLVTPRGGQYRITLPDGTKVWLNASSSLEYPTRFDSNERHVNLTGEAYFEVAHNANKAFVVYSGEQRTEVKGTKFNLSAYAEDQVIETTLLEGAVLVQGIASAGTEELLLKPNQQATLRAGKISKKQVDAYEAMAWSQGKFMFTDAPLSSIMRQLARWYDVEIDYLQPVDGITFSGSISRFENIEDVLRKLALTERIKFEIHERRIAVKRE